MELLRARDIQLMWDGDQICALVGIDLVKGVGGFGSTVPEALRDLASQIERQREIEIWVPQKATQYVEDGVLKSACPECGHVHVMSDYDEVIAYVCDECGAGVDVLPRVPDD